MSIHTFAVVAARLEEPAKASSSDCHTAFMNAMSMVAIQILDL